MDPRFCRAGRALVGMTQAELAKRSGIGLSTLITFEGGVRATSAANVAAMRNALEAAGVMLLDNGTITTADLVLDQIANNPNPSAAETALAITAAGIARQIGRQPGPVSELAAQIIKVGRRARGEDDEGESR